MLSLSHCYALPQQQPGIPLFYANLPGRWRPLYPFAGNCVRTVNYAQRRFIAFDQRQRATNIFRRSQFRRERIPCAQFLQCFFCINASGNMFRIANRQTTAIQQRSPVGFAVDGEIFLLAGFRCYNDQAIAEQCLTRSSIDRFLSTA